MARPRRRGGGRQGQDWVVELLEAVILGIVEGLTEFLPVSSTGHLTILEKLFGYTIDDPDITAFTAIIQSGAVLATSSTLREDIWRIVRLVRGCSPRRGATDCDYRFGWT